MAPTIKSVVKSSWGFLASALSSRRSSDSAGTEATEAEPPRKAPFFKRGSKLTKMSPQPPTPLRRRREDFGFPVLGSQRDREWEQQAFSANPQDFRRTPGRVHFAPFTTFIPNPPYPDTDDEADTDGQTATASTPADDAHAPPAEHTPSPPATIAISVFLEQIPEQFPKPAPSQPSDPLRFENEFLTSHVFGPIPQICGPLPAPSPYEISYEEARLSSAPYTPVSFEEQRILSSLYTPFGHCRAFPLHTVSRRLVVEEHNQDSFLPDAPTLVEDGSNSASDFSPLLPEPQSQDLVPVQAFPAHFSQPATGFPEADDQDIDLPDAPALEPEESSDPPQTPVRQIAQPFFVQTPAPRHPPFLPPTSEPETPAPVTPDADPANPLSPVPASPGDESRAFTYRRNTEGHKFAIDLFKSIRNDHYMRQCRCGLPTIFDSKDAAEAGKGHLRFYVLDGNKFSLTEDNLRVIQKKTDLQWHCSCSQSKKLDLVYRKHIYDQDFIHSRKRPAETSEAELRADTNTTQQEPMWSFVTDTAATMTATIKSLLGSWCPKFISDHIETIQTRSPIQTRSRAARSRESAETNDPSGDRVVVKRFKRQHALPLGTAPVVDLSEIPGLRWTSDPRRYIGPENIKAIHALYLQELVDIEDGKFRGASSTPHLWMRLDDERHSGDHNVIASINIHRTMEDMFGCVAFDSDEVRRDKWDQARAKYVKNLIGLLSFIEEIYDKDVEFTSAKSRFPQPPTNRRLGKVEFAQATGAAARFITWLLHGKSDWVSMPTKMMDTLAKMLADADAIHKHELVPSWVEYPGHNEEAGNDTTDIIAPSILWDEIPIEKFKAEASHEVRFPASMYPPTPARRELPNVVEDSPAPILKKRKVAFPEHVASPHYVATPMKRRDISFVNPVVKVARNIHQPARVLKPAERKRLGKEAVRQAEDTYQLREYHLKHANFLKTLEDNVNLQREFKQALAARRQAIKASPRANIRSDIARPTSEDREARLRRDEETRRVYELKKNLSEKLTALKENPVLSPGTKRKAIREPLIDTPEDRRKFLDLNPSTAAPVSFKPAIKPGARRHVAIDFAKEATRARTIKQEQAPAATPRDRRHLIDTLVDDKDDGAESLAPKKRPSMEISAKKQEDLELTRHLKSEFADSVAREINAAKKAEAEKKARIAAEAEAARLRAELAAAGGLRSPKVSLIGPLTQAWLQKVDAVNRANPKAQLAMTLEGTALERRDFVEKLLPKTAWLNDNIINGSILNVAAAVNEAAGSPETPKCAAFTSFFYNHIKDKGPGAAARTMKRAKITKANFLSIDTILIPICQGQHWTLAVVRPRDGIVAHIDSMRGGAGEKQVTDLLMAWVRATLADLFDPDHWRVHQYKAPRQSNGYDCGVFAITNAVCQALGVKMEGSYDQRQLTLQRSRIAAMLLNGGWTGDFALGAL